MSQSDIYEFLKFQRSIGNHEYWSIQEINKALKNQGLNADSTCKRCVLLQHFGYLEAKTRVEYHDVWMQNRTMRSFRFRIPVDDSIQVQEIPEPKKLTIVRFRNPKRRV
jgi:superfamily II helicase